ncbi:MAG: hypothetical protein Q8Q08_10085 [Candidatus Omnitrophota bacterium]|nr:hypothetical protein [Candidatus Omnitrophota bacterium]
MSQFIRKIKDRLGDSNFKILWFEQLLFSTLYGIAFRSWLVFGVMFLGSLWLLNRPRGVLHMIYAMSLLWGFIAFSIGYSISWGWAAALGGSFFLIGIRAHLTGLKSLVSSCVDSAKHEQIDWRRDGYNGLQNLN